MSRRKTPKKRRILEDPIYNSTLVSSFINKILIDGKRNTAQYIFYEVMKNIKETTHQDSLSVLKKAVSNVAPVVELKSRRVGGATYQVPIEISTERGNSLALRILIKSARNRAGRNMIIRLGNEIVDAYNNTGISVKRKEEIHRMSEANKAFSSFKF